MTYTLALPRGFKCSPTINADRLKPYYPARLATIAKALQALSMTQARKANTWSSNC